MQGFNMGRYVPPDQEGLVTSGNRLLGVRPQKTNAAGVPIVRFEMPFAVWCDGCQAQQAQRQPVLIGQGVRFNAEKHRTGAYHSTPIWTFRMRHPACGTWLAIRTDPANTAYVVESGGRRRREYDDDDDGVDGGAAGNDAAEGSAMDRLDAFDRLERTIAHRAAADAVTTASAASAATGADAATPTTTTTTAALPPTNPAQRIHALARANARQWQDPYARNRALRAAFRAGRHARQQAAADDDALRQRLGGLSDDLPLLPATDEDARHAALVAFGQRGVYGLGSGDGGGDGDDKKTPAAGPDGSQTPAVLADRRTLAKPLFGGPGLASSTSTSTPPAPAKKKTTTATTAVPAAASANAFAPTTQTARRRQAIRDHLAATVVANTRMAIDPFLAPLGGSDGLSIGPPIRGRARPKRNSRGTGADTSHSQEDATGASWKKRRRREEEDDGGGGTGGTGGTGGSGPAETAARPTGPAALALVNYDSD